MEPELESALGLTKPFQSCVEPGLGPGSTPRDQFRWRESPRVG